MYLIVGAKGFLGSYLIKNILEKTDDKIIATDIHIDKQEDTKRVRWIEADITMPYIRIYNKTFSVDALPPL